MYTTNPYTTSSTVALLGTGNGEVDTTGGTNYSVKTLTNLGVASSTAVASVDFDNVSYNSASFTAAFAAIYNTDTVDSTANRLVVVLDFGGNKTATNGTFTITFPDPATPANAIISMSWRKFMALVINDRVKETSTTTGTGAYGTWRCCDRF